MLVWAADIMGTASVTAKMCFDTFDKIAQKHGFRRRIMLILARIASNAILLDGLAPDKLFR